MRIYPDPELPDIQVEWFAESECIGASDRVVISLSTIDPTDAIDPADPTVVAKVVTVPCAEAGVRFDDVARVRYRVSTRLEDPSGTVFGGRNEMIDLRDGFGERVVAFFGRSPEPNFRVAWSFDMAASCASLDATQMVLHAALSEGPIFFIYAPCDAPVFVQALPFDGTYTLTAHASTDLAEVASSAPSAPFTITRGEIIDLGTLTLTPCGAACPSPGF
jgi:hypothetical protein